MECTVRWMGSDAGMSFVAESGSGHAVVMDGARRPAAEILVTPDGDGSCRDWWLLGI
jgi:hypothetical protein